MTSYWWTLIKNDLIFRGDINGRKKGGKELWEEIGKKEVKRKEKRDHVEETKGKRD